MKINGNTKVSKVIKENKEAIEVIASLNPNFKKLRNPVFRWLFSPHISLEEFAEQGKYDSQLLLDEVCKVGFEMEKHMDSNEVSRELVFFTAKLEFIEDCTVKSIDLNSLLENSEDSLFELIKSALLDLRPNEVLDAQLDSNPIFLNKLFEKMGYSTLAVFNEGIHHTYFKLDITRFQEASENLFYRAVEFKERILM